MKKALLVTNGSVDMALSLNQWLEAQSEPADLTVVYAFPLPPATGQPLNAATYRQSRQTAAEELKRWLDFLPESRKNSSGSGLDRLGKLHTELLPGAPELVLSIHLLLRRYDYLLIDFEQTELVSTFRSFQRQIGTQLCFLSVSEEAVSSSERTHQLTYNLPLMPTNCQLAA